MEPPLSAGRLAAMNRLRLVHGLALVFALVLAACGSAASPLPTGVVHLSLLAGPTCPVERIPPDPNCAPRPVADAEILVVTADGREVGRVKSDAAGRITLRLPLGDYLLRPQQAAGGFPMAPAETRITVGSVPAEVTLDYDTGIR